jgi:hypothetical protein
MDFGYKLRGSWVLHVYIFAEMRSVEMEFRSFEALLVYDVVSSLVP